jgi:hypothetical protein
MISRKRSIRLASFVAGVVISGLASLPAARAQDAPPPAGYPPAAAPSDPNAPNTPNAPNAPNAPPPGAYPAPAGAPPQYTPAVQQPAPPPTFNPLVAMPFLGVESIQNSAATGEGPGLRIGGIVGARLNDLVSINGEAAFDLSNLNNVPAGDSASEYTFQLSFAPLIHLVPPAAPIEIALGPKLGFFHVGESVSQNGAEQDASLTGWLAGLNVAVFGRLSDTLSLGGLFSFDYEKATTCSISPDTFGNCSTDGADGIKVIAFSAAALF